MSMIITLANDAGAATAAIPEAGCVAFVSEHLTGGALEIQQGKPYCTNANRTGKTKGVCPIPVWPL